ncbi:NAD(P)/FAD-dependent oxidoreductase [Thermogymnomonas acidicola]|nr:FAD-dependent oxidoreductase [Thermogymnomonas acidicola]
MERDCDIAIIGAGVLGTCLAHWISSLYSARVCLIDASGDVASHTTSRNTGVIHRPFYLDPVKKGTFARAASLSYPMWMKFARDFSLPWEQVGTVEVALSDRDLDVISSYSEYAESNGMSREEYEVLDTHGLQAIEGSVKALGAFFSKTDTSVDYGLMTRAICGTLSGVSTVLGRSVVRIVEGEGYNLTLSDGSTLRARTVFNCAGANSLRIAHSMGLARDLSVFFFRGDYWRLRQDALPSIRHNIYSVPRFLKFPFLDPHFIVRYSGVRELGPNAALVAGPYVYSGFSESPLQALSWLFERPVLTRLSLLTNLEFLGMVRSEWESSTSPEGMVRRLSSFIPSLKASMISGPGISGVRGSVVSRSGFVPEAVMITDGSSLHVINYNSPGATGAPAFSAYVLIRAVSQGLLREPERNMSRLGWDLDAVREAMPDRGQGMTA